MRLVGCFESLRDCSPMIHGLTIAMYFFVTGYRLLAAVFLYQLFMPLIYFYYILMYLSL